MKFIHLNDCDFQCFSAKKPTFDPASGPFYLFKNSQGVLKCEPEAAPPPTFKWYRKGTELTTGGRYTVQKDGVLLINDVTDDDAGDYRCVAKNFLAEAEYNGVATVYGKKNSILHSAVGPLSIIAPRITRASSRVFVGIVRAFICV